MPPYLALVILCFLSVMAVLAWGSWYARDRRPPKPVRSAVAPENHAAAKPARRAGTRPASSSAAH